MSARSENPQRRFLIALLVLLGGCSAEADVRELVRAGLKDPDSARFSDMVVIGDDAGRVACGMVNAKNSMGGYVGSTPYMLWRSELYMSADDDKAAGISSCCVEVARVAMDGGGALSTEAWAQCQGLPEGVPVAVLR